MILSYDIRIIYLLKIVFPYFSDVCYFIIVLRDRIKIKRKRVTTMKKLSELLKAYYETYKEGRG